AHPARRVLGRRLGVNIAPRFAPVSRRGSCCVAAAGAFNVRRCFFTQGIRMRLTVSALALLALVAACEEEDSPGPIPAGIAHVRAAMETTPVASEDDAADDPAVWVHP